VTSTTTNVEVCVSQEMLEGGRALVEVRQDGEVVGSVSLGGGGAAGIEVPPGPVEAYVSGDLVGSGDLGEGGRISFSCSTSPSTGGPTPKLTPDLSPSSAVEPTGAPTATGG